MNGRTAGARPANGDAGGGVERPSFFADFAEELEARTRIQDALYRHSRGIDRDDHHGARASAYHPDATVDSGFGPQPVANLLAARRRQHEHTRHAMHSVTNVLIEFVSARVAFVESHVTAVEWEGHGYDFASRGIAGPGRMGARIVSWCRYADVFEARAGAWRILERTVIFGDTAWWPLDAAPVLPPDFLVQEHGSADPMYARRARAGALAEEKAPGPRTAERCVRLDRNNAGGDDND
ncbi:nuclear transport factor 2 family protein [Amycolatopsis rhabdoformis]|uniref:Nuclear transport factor 2 family protein n=1 Tax=Amycolatopsis rhabdoformis TaxID=1448059 RepID=A0ABZ1IFA3_9PSEU|nr:nuclear transport factor 2 family protein [Amycolatopsis rhabdoformis]WSE32224.1 nuclear transport factor 2 family protein [Amycolatopsis rhabdoformis]